LEKIELGKKKSGDKKGVNIGDVFF